MKTLYLLRHAQALPADLSGGKDDLSRTLSPKGHEDAAVLGKVMKDRGYVPALALCSPARRTKETLAGALKALGPVRTLYEDRLYDSAPGTILHRLQQLEDRFASALVVAHNPGIHELALLLPGRGPASLLARAAGGYKPGTLSVVECSCESWVDLQPANGTLTDLLEPLDYNAPATPARWT